MDVTQFLVEQFGDVRLWGSVLSEVRFIFILLDILLLGFFIFTLMKALSIRPQFSALIHLSGKEVSVLKDSKVVSRWQELMESVASESPHAYTIAIIEADKLVDNVLKSLGFEGEHIADRIEQLASGNLATIDRLWKAHRVRNEIAHTPGFELTPVDAKQVLAAYEAFLKELGVL